MTVGGSTIQPNLVDPTTLRKLGEDIRTAVGHPERTPLAALGERPAGQRRHLAAKLDRRRR